MRVILCTAAVLPWLSSIRESLLSFAASLSGLGILLVALADSSFLTLPECNDLLIVLLAAGGTWKKMVFYVCMTILGSILGCLLLYSIGFKGGSPALRKRFSEDNISRAERLFAKYGILTVVIPSILPPPCPFKIFVLSAGVFRLSRMKFTLAVAFGRTIRYATWGTLAVLYGNPVQLYIQDKLQRVGLVLLGIFGFVLAMVVIYIIRHNRAKRPPEEA